MRFGFDCTIPLPTTRPYSYQTLFYVTLKTFCTSLTYLILICTTPLPVPPKIPYLTSRLTFSISSLYFSFSKTVFTLCYFAALPEQCSVIINIIPWDVSYQEWEPLIVFTVITEAPLPLLYDEGKEVAPPILGKYNDCPIG